MKSLTDSGTLTVCKAIEGWRKPAFSASLEVWIVHRPETVE